MPNSKNAALTKRQREIFEFLKDKILNRGYGPTVREIGDNFGIKSPNGVMCHLKALERKGLIRRESNMSRAICLSDPEPRGVSLPFLGTAVSGGPIQSAVSSDERVDFEGMFSGSGKGCLRVRGTAYHSVGIADGDMIVVDKDAEMTVGCTVAALDDRHCVTLSRVEGNGRQLVPVIPGAYPVPTRQVLGTVVGIVRQIEQPASPTSETPEQTTV